MFINLRYLSFHISDGKVIHPPSCQSVYFLYPLRHWDTPASTTQLLQFALKFRHWVFMRSGSPCSFFIFPETKTKIFQPRRPCHLGFPRVDLQPEFSLYPARGHHCFLAGKISDLRGVDVKSDASHRCNVTTREVAFLTSQVMCNKKVLVWVPFCCIFFILPEYSCQRNFPN